MGMGTVGGSTGREGETLGGREKWGGKNEFVGDATSQTLYIPKIKLDWSLSSGINPAVSRIFCLLWLSAEHLFPSFHLESQNRTMEVLVPLKTSPRIDSMLQYKERGGRRNPFGR